MLAKVVDEDGNGKRRNLSRIKNTHIILSLRGSSR
jgi:hypothetical protein